MRKLANGKIFRPLSSLGAAPSTSPAIDRLSDMTSFGSNPGALRARCYVPAALAPGAPLVVVLHGCTQTAAGYDHGAGWSALADRHGFALLFPEQVRSNNMNLCFNWFVPADTVRDSGEALSIRQMVDAMASRHDIARDRVFVTGLSAGGAMTSVMLATYPDVFAGGAIIAGLPYGGVGSVQGALASMRSGAPASADGLGARVRAASKHRGPWPTVSVWHGSADATVNPANSCEIVRQWADVHGLDLDESHGDTIDGFPRRTWRDAKGRALIEEYSITGMGHGTPLAPDDHGASGPHMLDVGISSSERIIEFWGLADAAPGRAKKAKPSPSARPPAAPAPKPATGIDKIIKEAFRAGGLIR